ncbi:DUF5615 family PIN-like protein [Roseibacillus ishigakijimensis]|uniref:DUF5615 family PIN-like protein n=1 Tax=Roseibacillus ishigakijimensis TaxID=454146 RepID=A0A934RJU0_9BACT|nr:DUF5615 family PIN-like protein [Roseibacillus ishigakijimensis]MBK1833002.1 DUF5615 family PIN-like protein [Roseibacillus ishigakijimensis]
MRFLLDENFPKAAGDLLHELGFEPLRAQQICGPGAADSAVLALARQKQAALLTTDRDFFHTLAVLEPDHYGIVVIALKQPSRSAIVTKLRWFLENIPLENLPKRAFQLRDRTWLCQPPLVS